MRIAWTRGRLSPDGWALLAIVGVVVLANLPYLLGIFEANPLGTRSGLLAGVVPGPAGGQPTIDPNNGFISQALSHRAVLDLVHLHLPWWNPFEGTGAPLAGEMQSAALFPPTLLTLLSNGQLYEHILLELTAGIATYLLLRRLCLSRLVATAAGMVFALNGTFAWLSHATVNPVALLPLLLLGIEHAYTASLERRGGGWWLIALSGVLSFAAGFPEVAYIDTLLALAWFIWRCCCLGRPELLRFLGKGAAGVISALMLAAPLLIAAVDYVNHADLGLHASTQLGSAHFGANALSQLVLPYVYGPIFDFADPRQVLPQLWGAVGGFLSTSLLLFAVLGLVARRRRGLRLTLLAWIVLAFARMYGEPPGLGAILGFLPEMSRVFFARYAFASLEFAVVVLAALGLEDVIREPARRRRVLWSAGAVLGLVVLAALNAHSLTRELGARFGQRPYFGASVTWGAAIVVVIAAASLLRGSRASAALVVGAMVVDSLVLFAAPELSAPRSVKTDLAPVAFLQAHLGHQRFFTLGPLQPNYGSYFAIRSLNVNDIPVPSPFQHFVNRRLDSYVDPTVFVGNDLGGRNLLVPSPMQELLRNLPAYRAAGVAYVLTPAGQALPTQGGAFTLVFRSPSTWIYHLSGAAPYFETTTAGCTAAAATDSSVRLSCPASTILIRRETYLPGWSAEVDGRSVPVRRSQGLFQLVRVSRGTHRVSFSYSPPHVGWGYLGFVLGCVWLLVAAVASRRARRSAAGAVSV